MTEVERLLGEISNAEKAMRGELKRRATIVTHAELEDISREVAYLDDQIRFRQAKILKSTDIWRDS